MHQKHDCNHNSQNGWAVITRYVMMSRQMGAICIKAKWSCKDVLC